jgi:hypothetical protein
MPQPWGAARNVGRLVARSAGEPQVHALVVTLLNERRRQRRCQITYILAPLVLRRRVSVVAD